MKKGKTKKIVLFLIIILIVTVGGVFGYFFISKKENPLQTLVWTKKENNKIQDNYNGIYTYYDDLDGTKLIYRGCSFNKIGNHILVMDDDYYEFRSSCMGTYLKDRGKTSDLEIVEEDKSFYINYKSSKFKKDLVTTKLILNNNIAENMRNIELSTYQLMLKETEFEGNYYDIKDVGISGISSNLRMSIIKDNSNNFTMSIRDKNERLLYSYYISNFNNLPDMYPYGINVVVIEKGKWGNRFNYNFKVVNSNGITYNLFDKLPIKVDDALISTSNSIFIKYDQANRYFRMLVGFDDKMCATEYSESEKNDITYYEFRIDYNYKTNTFNNPMYVKTGRKSEGCKYVNNIIGG